MEGKVRVRLLGETEWCEGLATTTPRPEWSYSALPAVVLVDRRVIGPDEVDVVVESGPLASALRKAGYRVSKKEG